MTLVVPYDGSELSRTALARATQFDQVLDDGVLAVTVIPNNNAKYARARGWLEEGEAFDREKIRRQLETVVQEVNPEATFETISVSRYAQAGEIASKLRRFARNNGASIVFIGSENAGRVARPVSSVGGTVATDRAYDTMIISRAGPSNVSELEAGLPTGKLLG